MNRKPLLAALPVLFLFTVAAMQQDGILLRRQLKEGEQTNYRIEISGDMKADIPTMGEQDMGMKGGMDYSMKLGKVDGNKADAEILVSNVKMEVTGPMADMAPPQEAPKDQKSTGKIDNLGRVILNKTAGMSPELMMMAGPGMNTMGQTIEFPEKAVKIGDTWTVTVPKSPMSAKVDSQLTAKLIGESELEGVPVYEITLEGKTPLDIDFAEVLKAMPDSPMAGMLGGMSISLKGSVGIKSKGFFERSTGKAIKLETTLDNDQTINIEQMGMSVKTVGKIVIKMSLKK
ncbi:MAG: hypothetical protein HZC36_05045 [Armatimonadetes bacterium]|nr:hypothetical protein [Armatimonadota bacterium]